MTNGCKKEEGREEVSKEGREAEGREEKTLALRRCRKQ
jgi:hypothetical protein